MDVDSKDDKHRDHGGREEAERLIRRSLPGTEQARMVAGSLEDPSVGAYVAAVSRLGDSWYTSLLELYDPYAEDSVQVLRAAPRQFPGVPPTQGGVAVRLRREYEDPIEAGAAYGFLRHALLEEAVEPEKRATGLKRLEQWIAKCEQDEVFDRLYANAELAADPHYRAELERQIMELVPDPEEREALHSFHAFRHSRKE